MVLPHYATFLECYYFYFAHALLCNGSFANEGQVLIPQLQFFGPGSSTTFRVCAFLQVFSRLISMHNDDIISNALYFILFYNTA